MNKEIDNILEGYHLREYDLITVKQKLLVLFSVDRQRELFFCNHDDASVRCREQCLDCTRSK